GAGGRSGARALRCHSHRSGEHSRRRRRLARRGRCHAHDSICRWPMFTGLIEEVGHVVTRDGARLVVAAKLVIDGTQLGASVAVNGACLTVVERGTDRLAFDLGPETLARTALGELGPGDPVNLERPLKLGG